MLRHISVVDSNLKGSLPWKCDGSLLEGVDGDIVGGEVAQVVEELVLHRRRQRPSEVLDVFKGENIQSDTSFIYVLFVG